MKYFIMDVDGTLTDGKIYIGENGEIMKAFSVKDGYGIHDILIPNKVVPVIITGRKSEIVTRRCEEIGITEIHQGVGNKMEVLMTITTELNSVAFIGDDINDLPCILEIKKAGGIIGCPRDAVERVIKQANYISRYEGGNGAVRDFIEWLLLEGYIK